MKSITLNNIGRPDKTSHYMNRKMYSVFLGNDLKEYFSSLRDAKQFMADLNRFLNTRMHELNYIYIEVFRVYRNAWFFFTSEKNGNNFQFDKLQKEINNKFIFIDKSFELLVKNHYSANSNYFVFKHFFDIIGSIYYILDQVKTILIQRKYYADVQKIKMLDSMIKNVDSSLKNYGKDHKLKDYINSEETEKVHFL